MLVCFNDFPLELRKTINSALLNIPNKTFKHRYNEYCDLILSPRNSALIPVHALKSLVDKEYDGWKYTNNEWTVREEREMVSWLECFEFFGILTDDIKTQLTAVVLSSKDE